MTRKNICYIGIGLLLLSLLFWGWMKLHNPNTLPIQEVKVAGDYQHTKKSALKHLIMPYAKNGFFAVDIEGLKQQLSTLPWIDKVKVTRFWPNQLVIQLKEQKPYARWDKASFLNKQGEVFTPNKTSINAHLPAHLPILSGPESSQNIVLEKYQQISAMLSAIGLQVIQLDLTQRHTWQMTLNNRMVVKLGKEEPMVKLHRFIDVYPKVFSHLSNNKNRTTTLVDMRYTNGMAVQKTNKK